MEGKSKKMELDLIVNKIKKSTDLIDMIGQKQEINLRLKENHR